MEGDDAIEFFSEFKREFSVDLSKLDLDWNSYFAREGVSLVTAATVLVLTVILGITFSRLLPHWPALISWIAGFIVSFAVLFVCHALVRQPNQKEITVGELIEAAECGELRLKPGLQESSRAVAGS